jgi:hypothetical protein
MGEWCVVKFKYEKLRVFCFVCGVVGHKNKCAIHFDMKHDGGSQILRQRLGDRAVVKHHGG